MISKSFNIFFLIWHRIIKCSFHHFTKGQKRKTLSLWWTSKSRTQHSYLLLSGVNIYIPITSDRLWSLCDFSSKNYWPYVMCLSGILVVISALASNKSFLKLENSTTCNPLGKTKRGNFLWESAAQWYAPGMRYNVKGKGGRNQMTLLSLLCGVLIAGRYSLPWRDWSPGEQIPC